MAHGLGGTGLVPALVAALLFAACTNGGEDGTASGDLIATPSSQRSSTATTETPSPVAEPTQPPKPNPREAPVDGTYNVLFSLVKSEGASNLLRRYSAIWTFEPNCRPGRPCTSALHSELPEYDLKYDLRATYVNGRYRWTQRVVGYSQCLIGGSATDLPSVLTFTVRGSQVKQVDGDWVVSRFTGIEEDRTTKPCGFTLETRRYVIKGVRI